MAEQQALPSPPDEASGQATESNEVEGVLELGLMHEWTAYASKTFSTAWEFWSYRAPALVAAKRSHDMIIISRQYFDRAIDRHRKALANLTVDNIESVYMTSVLVAFNALFMLGEDEKDPTLPALDPILWLRLASGTAMVCERWRELIGEEWVAASGLFYGKPDLSNNAEFFKPEHAKPFEKLLTYAQEYERVDKEDQEVYAKALSYVGLIYKGIQTKSDHPMATCRRLFAMPSRLPLRFTAMAEQGQPRAMAILAHVFACMRLLDDKVLWFKGVAERQIPRIEQGLPQGWKNMLEWPMAVAGGDVSAIGGDASADENLPSGVL
ncbi:hypothetical protein LTR65_007216 [Meristemomyces frigidus]